MKPVMPYNLSIDGDYWASWGSKGWSAVRVNNVKRKFAKVSRVDPKTNEVKKRGAKVRADEMVKRDPSQCGADKPTEGPDVVFADVREYRARTEAKQLHLNKNAEEADGEPTVEMPEEELRVYRANMARDSARRWENVEKGFGPEIVASWATDEDW